MTSAPDSAAAAAAGSAELASPPGPEQHETIAAAERGARVHPPAHEQGRAALDFYTESVTVYEDA